MLGRPRLLDAPQAIATWRSVYLALDAWTVCLYAGQTQHTSGAWVDAYVRNIIIFIIINIINIFERKYYIIQYTKRAQCSSYCLPRLKALWIGAV